MVRKKKKPRFRGSVVWLLVLIVLISVLRIWKPLVFSVGLDLDNCFHRFLNRPLWIWIIKPAYSIDEKTAILFCVGCLVPLNSAKPVSISYALIRSDQKNQVPQAGPVASVLAYRTMKPSGIQCTVFTIDDWIQERFLCNETM